MAKYRKLPKTRNPMARALASPLFRQRVVPNGKVYSRRAKTKRDDPREDA